MIQYGGASVSYTASASATGGVTYLAVYGGSGGNTFNVQDINNLHSNTFLSTGNGNDAVNIYATSGGLYLDNPGGFDITDVGMGNTSKLNGFVFVGAEGSTSLAVDDSSDATGRTVTMGDGNVYGLGSGGVFWSATSAATGGVTSLTVRGGSGGNTFNINNTSIFYGDSFLSTGTGNDVVNIYATQGGLYDYNPGGQDSTNVGLGNTGNIAGFVDAYGAGATSLDLNDENDTTVRTVTMNDGSVTGAGSGTISWTPTSSPTGGVTYVEVDGGSANDTFNIKNTSDLYYDTYLLTGVGTDTIDVHATKVSGAADALQIFNRSMAGAVDVGLGSVANIKGSILVEGFGAAKLLVDDHLDSTSRTATLTNGSLTGLGNTGAIQYYGVVHSLTVDGPAQASTYNIQSTGTLTSVTVSGGAGNDIFNVGSGNSLNGIQGALTINGGGGTNMLNINDSGSASGQSYALSSTKLARTGIATIAYASLAGINVTASGNDTLTLLNPVPTVSTNFDGGSGTNTLHGANVSNSWTISGADSGKLDSVGFSNFSRLVGGTGVDVFNFSGTGAKVLSINGGGAPAHMGDWLNYSAFPGGSTVTVNLATGSATNVNGGAAGAVTNIQNVVGSAGGTNTLTGDAQGNVLIGGSGSNTLIGGSGGSLLIGGSGSGTITGGAATDILIAGTTTFNATTTAGQDALMAILAELQSADTFAEKVSDIINGSKAGGGSDLNGSNRLTWGGASATVKASTGSFTLTGDTSAQTTADWFFANASSTITDFNDDGVKDQHNNNAIGVF
jgi:hypothetical protein